MEHVLLSLGRIKAAAVVLLPSFRSPPCLPRSADSLHLLAFAAAWCSRGPSEEHSTKINGKGRLQQLQPGSSCDAMKKQQAKSCNEMTCGPPDFPMKFDFRYVKLDGWTCRLLVLKATEILFFYSNWTIHFQIKGGLPEGRVLLGRQPRDLWPASAGVRSGHGSFVPPCARGGHASSGQHQCECRPHRSRRDPRCVSSGHGHLQGVE
jgi:hypothetical protein